MSTCPSCGLAVWVYVSHPSKFVEEHLQHTCYKGPYKQPLIPPYVSYRKAFGKTSTSIAKFLLSRSCYRTPGNNVPSPNPRILYVSSLSHHSSLTQGTLSPSSIFGSLLYLTQITFPSSSHASYLLCSVFTRG